MGNYIITLLPEEEKALLTDMISIQDWVDNLLHEKARRIIDTIVKKHSDLQPSKMSMTDKLKIIKKIKLETAQEKNDKVNAELLNE